LIKRFFMLALSPLFFFAAGAGCADLHDDGEVAFVEGAAEICPTVYEPVCGKDGLTYGNECLAGGKRNVAYEGECVDACISVTCPEGTECYTNNRGQAVCESIDEPGPCATIRCADGYICVERGNKGACVQR